MAIKGEWVPYGEQAGYLALPDRAATPLPGVVVIQEIGGVNDQIEDVTRRIAAAGYVALAPDLFAVKGQRPAPLSRERISRAMDFIRKLPPGAAMDASVRNEALAKLPETDSREIGESMAQIWSFASPARAESMVGPLRSAVRFLREERPETRQQKVGCVGFCMGGGLSALLACEEPELAAAAVYYGNAPSPEKIARISCPVIAFYGEKDQRVNAGIPGFEEAMRKGGKSFEHHIYPGAAHGFFNDDAAVYDVRAARDSFARLLSFFLRHLAGDGDGG